MTANDSNSGRPLAADETPPQPDTRAAHDAASLPALARNPHDKDAQLDVELDESFPSSDPPSNTQPGKGLDPAPSSGFSGPAASPPPLDGE